MINTASAVKAPSIPVEQSAAQHTVPQTLLLYLLPGASQQSIPFPIYLMLVVTLSVYFTWLYNNAQGSLVITTLAHFCFNLSGGFIAGILGLMPPMILNIAAGSLLVLVVIGIVIAFGPRTLSKKPESELEQALPLSTSVHIRTPG